MPTKTWVVGEEVLAADFNTMVQQQVVATFANTAARSTALPSPKAGMQTWLDDVKRMEVWDGTKWVANRIAGSVKHTAAVALPNAADTVVPLGTLDYSTGGISTDGTRLVVPVAGIYEVTGSIGSMNGGGNTPLTGMVQGSLNCNGTPSVVKDSAYYQNWFITMAWSGMMSLAAGGLIWLSIYNGSAAQAFADPAGGAQQPCRISATLVATT